MGQNDRQTTRVILEDTDPLFRQEFAFLVYNPCVDDLNIKVIDYDDTVIGTTMIRTSDIMAEPGHKTIHI